MAATKTVTHRPPTRNSARTADPTVCREPSLIMPNHGVVALSGYGIRVRVDRGHLILEDGIGDERRAARFSRVGHGLERLVIVGADGAVSLAALRWLADQKAAFVMLERDGSVLAITGPVRSSDPRLRRAQACADSSGAGLLITRELINRKIEGQERLVRECLRDSRAANAIAGFRAQLDTAKTVQEIRGFEALAAQAYWDAWHDLAVSFPKADLRRTPEHWRVFGTRRSPLTGSPKRAANPANAALNYLYTMLETETRLAIAVLGLDPGLGFLHADEARDSLACDLMEPVRPEVDRFLLDWISRAPFKREWFFELRDGNCRLMAPFVEQLSETAPMWRQAVAPLAEWVAQTLWSSIGKPTRKPGPATRLTQRRNREAKGSEPLPPVSNSMQPKSLCRSCGVEIKSGGRVCSACNLASAAEKMKNLAPSGWAANQSAQAQALRSQAQQRHAAAQKAWDPASHPSWLNEDTYRQKIQPLLKRISTSALATALGVSWAYASLVRKGQKLPHPRHWVRLAEVVGFSAGGAIPVISCV